MCSTFVSPNAAASYLLWSWSDSQKDSGLSCQLGTLVGETGVLSRAAEIFGERVEGFNFLEGKRQNLRLLVEDVVENGQTHGDYGLGITMAEERLARWTASRSNIFQQVQGVRV